MDKFFTYCTLVFILSGCSLFCYASVPADSISYIVAPDASPELISDQFSFTEGPSRDKKGNVFFTDQPNNKIWKYGTDGKLSLFKNNAGRSNGTYFDKKGNLVTCADENNQLWSISPKGKVKVLLDNFQGKVFNGPNDLWIDARGGIYFTDPYYQRPYWTRKDKSIENQSVYYLPAGKNAAVTVAGDLKKPNGIIGTADGKYLYVADMGARKTFRYVILPDGTLNSKQLYINESSDGMTIDEHGNIYITGDGVSVYNPEGIRIAHIPIPSRWTANVCFGGRHRDLLFITASECVYILKMNVKGIE